MDSKNIQVTIDWRDPLSKNSYFYRDYIPGGGGGGVLRFGSDEGVPLKPPNPYPSLRVILAEKGTHY